MNCKRQKVYKGMKIGYILAFLLLLVACKPYDDYKERGHWKQLKENERIGFYWRHNDKIYAALGDSAVLIKYVKPMEDVDIATFYVNKKLPMGWRIMLRIRRMFIILCMQYALMLTAMVMSMLQSLLSRVPFPLLLDMSGMGKELMGIRCIDMVGEKTSEGVDKLTSCL